MDKSWLVGCLGFNVFWVSISAILGHLPESGWMKNDRREKKSKQPRTIHTASAENPCFTIIQIRRTPRHWNLPSTITRPPHALMDVSADVNFKSLTAMYSGISTLSTWEKAKFCLWRIRPQGYKLFSCSTQLSMKFKMHRSIKDIKKFGFLGSDMPRMLFFPLINVKMPTIVGI